MTVTVNLMSSKKGELKKFWETLEDYHQVDEDVVEWMYIYNKPEDAVETINYILRKRASFEISLWVQVGDEDLVSVNEINQEKVVKEIFSFSNQNAGLKIV